MRQNSNSKRSRSRGGGRRSQHGGMQGGESNGPDGRVRGNLNQIIDKYLAMARDASSSGDRISAENYYQHAEHYLRQMQASQGENGRGSHDKNRRANGHVRSNGTRPHENSELENAETGNEEASLEAESDEGEGEILEEGAGAGVAVAEKSTRPRRRSGKKGAIKENVKSASDAE